MVEGIYRRLEDVSVVSEKKKHVPLVRLELTTSASLFVYKYSALTDCATGADGGDRYKSTLIANTHGHTLTRRANEPRSPF